MKQATQIFSEGERPTSKKKKKKNAVLGFRIKKVVSIRKELVKFDL